MNHMGSHVFLARFLKLLTIYSVSGYMNRCFQSDDMRVLWTKHVGRQFISGLQIADLTPSPGLEILAQSQSGDVLILNAKSGDTIQDWPVKTDFKSSHSSPLLYDVDRDGVKDVVVIGTEGDIATYDIHGRQLYDYSTKLQEVYVRKDWFKIHPPPIKQVTNLRTMNDLVLDERSDVNSDYIAMSPHVFATGVIEDINADNVFDELLLSVTYMIESEEVLGYKKAGYVNIDDMKTLPHHNANDYLLSAVVIFNMTTFKESLRYFTELDRKTSNYPPYALVSPLVVSNMDTKLPHILLATSGGKITQLNYLGHEVQNSIVTEGITEDMVAEDIAFNEKDQLEFVYADKQGHIVCVDTSNFLIWDTDVKGNVTGLRLFERKTVDGTLVKIVVASTSNGKVWLLDGRDGKPLPKWPIKLGKSLLAPPNILQIIHDGLLYVGTLDTDGYLHMVSIDQGCKYSFEVGETTRVGFAIHDLDPSIPGMEFLIATTHGTIIAVGLNIDKQKSGYLLEHGVTADMFNTSFLSLYAWPGEKRSHNVHIHSGNTGCFITNVYSEGDGYFTLDFTLMDYSQNLNIPSRISRGKWTAIVTVGNKMVAELLRFSSKEDQVEKGIRTSRDVPIGSHTVTFQFDKLSEFIHVEVRCYQHYTQLYSDMRAYQIEQTWSTDIVILFMIPVVFMFLVFIVDKLVKFKPDLIIGNHHLD